MLTPTLTERNSFIDNQLLHSVDCKHLLILIYLKLFAGKGGDLTLFMTGQIPRPRTEPMYTGGNRWEFNITGGQTVDYTNFIAGYIQNTEKLVISQCMDGGKFCGIFATSKLYSRCLSQSWGIRENLDSFYALVEEKWKWVDGKSENIYSLACDETLGFGVFLMEGYGTNQSILTGTDDIGEKWDNGLMITACAARDSTFYIIMTEDTKEYHGKGQKWFTRNTWKDASDEIQEGYRDGYAITGICYSTGLKQYFVAMTETPERQDYKWFNVTEEDCQPWLDQKYLEDLHPTIIFKDPTDATILIVTTEDENISDYEYTYNNELS